MSQTIITIFRLTYGKNQSILKMKKVILIYPPLCFLGDEVTDAFCLPAICLIAIGVVGTALVSDYLTMPVSR